VFPFTYEYQGYKYVNINGCLDCLTTSVFGKSIGRVIVGKDDGSIESLIKGWEYVHWASHAPILHKVHNWCVKLTGRNLWGKRVVGVCLCLRYSLLINSNPTWIYSWHTIQPLLKLDFVSIRARYWREPLLIHSSGPLFNLISLLPPPQSQIPPARSPSSLASKL
jgi:hypothetical protein